ncbi:dihydrofolate reductase family protein [Bailinhaonella thermotolerans]|uniref:Dihydrofolate reductase n=1 Tax=Bailinhaonella thermotolerans TaxID=1070861 RepID=A0A3A4A9S8_9ACTN|nr:dihydrofolate reductase family protein [Bailinhaonella thermotolerans]RJL23084.1 dihydrofolate reductase [Bailinhaonella thermotolerans]
MRKIIAGLFISADGVVEAPERWHFPYFDDEMGAAVAAQMDGADALLLGRRTYEDFVGHWPHQGDDVPFARHINSVAKYVVSTTLDGSNWNNTTVIRANVLDEIAALKSRPGGHIGMSGSPTLVRTLIGAGLLDELRLLVHPIVLGAGRRLWDGLDKTPLTLTGSAVFGTGVLSLTYSPAR